MSGLRVASITRFCALTALLAACSSSSGTPGPAADASHDAPSHDAGAPKDAPHDVIKDATKDAPHDAGTDATLPPGITCGQLLLCDQKCGSSMSCTNGCYAESTGVAQGLFDAFNDCLNAACAGIDASDCDTTAATGACSAQLLACESDKSMGPEDPDGGGVVPVADAGPELNCGEYIACLAACTTDAGSCTSKCVAGVASKALAGALDACLAMACPSTDGGPCAMPGLACNGCIEQVELAEPDTCASQYIACNADTTNLPDGGGNPKSLVDGGVITTLIDGLDQAASTIVASNGYLYYTQVITGSPVLRIPLVDGGAVESLGPPQPTPVSLAVDSSNAYVWSVGTFDLSSSTNNHDGTVVQVPLDGSAAVTLATGMEVFYDAAYLNAVAIDSANVYWVAGASGSDGTIMKTAIGSASPVAIYSGQELPQAVTTDGTNVYWADWGTFNASGISNGDGTVWQGPVGGGTAIMLASHQAAPSAIAVDANNVYWTDLGPLGGDNLPAVNSGSVLRTPIGGGTVTTIASSQAVPVAILVAGSNVYWSQYGLSEPGLIMTASVSGGPPIALAAGLDDPAALAIGGSTLYWTNANSSPTSGSISALTPY